MKQKKKRIFPLIVLFVLLCASIGIVTVSLNTQSAAAAQSHEYVSEHYVNGIVPFEEETELTMDEIYGIIRGIFVLGYQENDPSRHIYTNEFVWMDSLSRFRLRGFLYVGVAVSDERLAELQNVYSFNGYVVFSRYRYSYNHLRRIVEEIRPLLPGINLFTNRSRGAVWTTSFRNYVEVSVQNNRVKNRIIAHLQEQGLYSATSVNFFFVRRMELARPPMTTFMIIFYFVFLPIVFIFLVIVLPILLAKHFKKKKRKAAQGETNL